jgi:hypothetical protein
MNADPLIFGEQAKAGDAETPSQEDVAGLLNGLRAQQEAAQREPGELEIACGGQLLLVQCPAIFLINNTEEFVVNDLQAWGWTPFGVLAVGHYAKDDEGVERSILFRGEEISSIELQKDLYQQILTDLKAEAEAEESAEPAAA